MFRNGHFKASFVIKAAQTIYNVCCQSHFQLLNLVLIPRHVCSYETDDIESVKDYYGQGSTQAEKDVADLSYEYNKFKGGTILNMPEKLKGIITNQSSNEQFKIFILLNSLVTNSVLDSVFLSSSAPALLCSKLLIEFPTTQLKKKEQS